MIGSINCVYETPCGWCSKWDKKCDRKMPEIGKHCSNESDHHWEVTGVSMNTNKYWYRCKKCGARKHE